MIRDRYTKNLPCPSYGAENIHGGARWTKFKAPRRAIPLHYTPLHASWVNQVETTPMCTCVRTATTSLQSSSQDKTWSLSPG